MNIAFGTDAGVFNHGENAREFFYMNEAGMPVSKALKAATLVNAQLLGMSDHISFNLASAGYNVAKYVPYGPVKDVLPYLIRRAEENTSVAGQTSRELTLLSKERARRKQIKR